MQAPSYPYPEDTSRRLHLSNLTMLLEGELDDEEEKYFDFAGYGSYEYMKEMGEETNA